MILNKNIILLFLAQGISGAVVSLLTFSSALTSKHLLNCHSVSNQILNHTHSSNLTTLSVSTTFCGAFLAVLFSSSLIQKFGHKKVFLVACFLGMLGSCLAVFSLMLTNFILFCVATFLLGFFTALNGFYRFLAAQALAFSTQDAKNKATAFILSGGILGAILGPNLANTGANSFNIPFVGSFCFAFLLSLINFIITLPLSLECIPAKQTSTKIPILQAFKEKNFILASLFCAFGFAFMTLLMNAAPLAMNENFTLGEAKNVIVWHFIAMYAPSFFLAFFVRKISAFNLALLGFFLYGMAAVLGLLDESFWAFWTSLVLVGVGWAFSFNGGTFLLNAIKSPHILHLQSLNQMAVFGANLLASFSVGIIFANGNWWVLNFIFLTILIIVLALVFYLKNSH